VPEAPRVRVDIADHVAEVALTRPEKHNALDGEMFTAILGAAEQVAATPGLRAVILYGEGPSFCSGLDVASLASGPISLDDILSRNGRRANLAQRACTDWIDLEVPVIAALHGNCFGGGLQIALGADIRIATPDATLSVMEVRWGLVPDMGITSTLPRLVAIDVAKELTYTGRRVDGAEAQRLGIVTRLADDALVGARELARELAARSPDAVRSAKALYDRSWNAPVDDGLLLETQLQRALIGSPNQLAAVQAGFTGEAANFSDSSERGGRSA